MKVNNFLCLHLVEDEKRKDSNDVYSAFALARKCDTALKVAQANNTTLSPGPGPDRHPDEDPAGADGWKQAGEGQSIGRPG